ALDEELARNPGGSPFRKDSKPWALREKQGRLEAQLETIGPVIDTLTSQVNLAKMVADRKTVEAATARLAELFEEAEALFAQAGDVFPGGTSEGLLAIWNRYAGNREARTELRREIGPVLHSVRTFSPEAAMAFDELVDPETESAPKDIAAFLALIVEI